MANGNSAAETYGWDTVFAIPIPCVNEAIVNHRSSPAGFAYSDSEIDASATFGDWQIVQGGSGKAICLSLPLQSVTLAIHSTGKHLAFPTGTAVIEVQLQYVAQGGANAGDGQGTPHHLVVMDQPAADNTPPAVLSRVTIAGMDDVPAYIFAQGLLNWLNAHLGEFAHVFAVVNLNRLVDQGAWGFVTPNCSSYAYLDADSLETSVLAVLCMTGDRTAENLAQQASASAIPAGSVAGFLLSQTRTLDDLVRAAVGQAYPTLQPADLVLNPEGTALSMTQGTTVRLKSVRHDGRDYHPVLTEFAITALGSTLTLTSFTTVHVSPGITATCQTTHQYTIALGASSHGQTLQFQQVQAPTIVHNIIASHGVEVTEVIVAIVAALALLVLSVVTDGATAVVAGLVIGLVAGASQILPAVIEKVNTDDAPAIDLLLANALGPLDWTDSGTFSLTYAGLNVSLQLGGNPNFVSASALVS